MVIERYSSNLPMQRVVLWIEEKIFEMAKKKQQLAEDSMARGKLDKREVQEARMQAYRSLFR